MRDASVMRADRKGGREEWRRRRSVERLESPFAREYLALTSCARGCWWSQCRCSNIPLTGANTAHIASRTASGDTPVPRRIFNRTRAAITDNARARKAWHILSAPAGATHLYGWRGGWQRRATHVRYHERGGGGDGGGGGGTPTTRTAAAAAKTPRRKEPAKKSKDLYNVLR